VLGWGGRALYSKNSLELRLCLRRRRARQNHPSSIRTATKAAAPPTEPPIIAPFFDEEAGAGTGVGVGVLL
jgi:hypothetical protein